MLYFNAEKDLANEESFVTRNHVAVVEMGIPPSI
jgi:hypothetical protein